MKTLKVHKASDKVIFTLNEKSFWSKELQISLAIALLLHLTAVVLFPIDWGSWIKSLNKIGPIQVTTESPMTITALDHPHIPQYPKELFAYERMEQKIHLVPISFETPNTSIEKSSYYESYALPEEAPTKATLKISKGFPIKTAPHDSLTSKHPCKAVLDFQALTETGALFWLKWKETTGDVALDRQIEKYLHNLRLNIDSKEFVVQGLIEMEFR